MKITEFDNNLNAIIENLMSLLSKGYRCAVGFSGGKDSSVVLGVLLNAMLRLKSEGVRIEKQYLVTSDTGIENPIIDGLKKRNLKALNGYCQLNGLDIEIIETTPSLMQSWQVKVLGSRVLPTSVNSTYRQCAIDLKITGNTKAVNAIRNKIPASQRYKFFTALGSRDLEGSIRKASIEKKGGDQLEVTYDDKGHGFLYPIKHLTVDEVWYFLNKSGQSTNSQWQSYLANHDEIIEAYRDSAGECVLVQADTNEDGITANNQSSCGSRHGCSQCLANGVSEDKSMTMLLGNDFNKYGFMKPLNDARNYLAANLGDYSKRRMTGRTLSNGYMKIGPDCLGAEVVRNLLKAYMSADLQEVLEAERLGIKPRFQMITIEHLLAIEWSWMTLGVFKKPFEALKVFHEVYNQGDLLFLDGEYPITTNQKLPKARYLKVGNDWFNNQELSRGLLNPLLEAATEGNCTDKVSLKSGKQVHSLGFDEGYSIDEEGAFLLIEFELDRLLAMRETASLSYGVSTLLTYGCFTVPESMANKMDETVARLQRYEELGVVGLDWGAAQKTGISHEEFKGNTKSAIIKTPTKSPKAQAGIQGSLFQ